MKSRLLFRIVAPSLAVCFLLLALGALSGWYVHRQQGQASRLLTASVHRIRAAEEMASGIREARFQLGQYAVSGATEHLDSLPPILTEIRQSLSQVQSLSQPEDDRHLLEQVGQGLGELTEQVDALRQNSTADARTRAQHLGRVVVTEEILAPAQQYLDASEAAIGQSSQRSQAIAGRVALSLLLLGVCGSVAGLVAGFAIARGVRHSLFELYVPIRTATGKLEEVIGPIDVAEPRGIHDLDSVLASLAERIGVVVDRLRQSQLDLLRAEQMAALGQLAAGLAHELRNPLMSMKILVQTAAEAGESARLEGRDVTVLEEELTRLEQAIQRFLDFARPPTLEKHLFDVRAVLRRTLELVSARAARQQVSIAAELPDTPVEIQADREQIRQVLLNTVLNSLDAVGEGGHIRIGLCHDTLGHGAEDDGQAEATAWVAITVADDGPGIPEELGQRIFDPFVSTKETGLGLGLAICRRIVEAHGGQIAAGNAIGGGAEFVIRLPSGAPIPISSAD